MYDISLPKRTGIEKLQEWRNRYSPAEYPEKVIINMFYELFGIEGIWNEISSGFDGRQRSSNFGQAYQAMINAKRSYQATHLRERLPRLMAQDVMAADTQFSDYREKQQRATSGDNAAVVEVEYGYWFYNQYCAATLAWGACGLLGMGKHQAFLEVAGGDVGGLRFDSFRELLRGLQMTLGAVFCGFVDWQGNPIDQGLIMSGQVRDYYPADFSILPPLWGQNTGRTNAAVASNSGSFLSRLMRFGK